MGIGFIIAGLIAIRFGYLIRFKVNEAYFNRVNPYGVTEYASYDEMLDFQAWNNWKLRMGGLLVFIGTWACVSGLFGIAPLIRYIQYGY